MAELPDWRVLTVSSANEARAVSPFMENSLFEPASPLLLLPTVRFEYPPVLDISSFFAELRLPASSRVCGWCLAPLPRGICRKCSKNR